MFKPLDLGKPFMTPRQQATEYLLHWVQEIDPSGHNKAIMEKELASLTDEQFSQLMDDYLADKDRPCIYAPNFGPVNLDVERNLEIGKRIGHEFFSQLVVGSSDPDTPTYITPPKYLVLDMPWRRTVQLQQEGISVAEHNNSVDQRTGAVTGASAASKLSAPEMGVLAAMGMDNTIKELASVRGGDEGGWAAMEAMFQRDGEASLSQISQFATGPESVKALSSLLTSMHIANSL